MNDQERLTLVVGRIVKPHGVHGELVVDVRTDSPEHRFAPGAVLGVRRRGPARGQAAESLTVQAARPHSGRLLVRAEEVVGRDAADGLRGALLTVSSDELESIDDPDEFHDYQLEGLPVVLVTGQPVGVVGEIVHTPAGELLAVRSEDRGEVLVPFVTEIVPEVDLEARRIVVDPPEGLFGEA